MPNTLLLCLEGPLQAWGERGRWGVRDSAPEPTKSGVIGLHGCAMGISDDEPLRHLSDNLRMGVRVDQIGTRLTDYHTTGGGHGRPMMLTADGKFKETPELSWRDYLCDASFRVALQSDDETLIDQLAQAVQNPVWPFYLGRKACIPSKPVFESTGKYDTLTDALLSDCEATSYHYLVVEAMPSADAVRRIDNLISRRYRTYAPRYVRIEPGKEDRR